jgi:ABC-2 type transport system permease protein
MLGAGLNTLPPALLLLGLGAMVFGLVPRWAVALTYAILVWSLLVEITGGIVNVNHWILDTSDFHQMTPAPSMPIDWTTNGVMIALGVVTASIGVAAFRRRDLKGE